MTGCERGRAKLIRGCLDEMLSWRQGASMVIAGSCGCSTRTTVEEPVCLCSVTAFARLIGRRYALALLGTIGNAAPIRFGELRERVGGISPSTLAERLEELETAGLIRRDVYA